jgi:hypothetical protein
MVAKSGFPLVDGSLPRLPCNLRKRLPVPYNGLRFRQNQFPPFHILPEYRQRRDTCILDCTGRHVRARAGAADGRHQGKDERGEEAPWR